MFRSEEPVTTNLDISTGHVVLVRPLISHACIIFTTNGLLIDYELKLLNRISDIKMDKLRIHIICEN